jgi:hypothetical protein
VRVSSVPVPPVERGRPNLSHRLLVTRERLAELEHILERGIARRKAERLRPVDKRMEAGR